MIIDNYFDYQINFEKKYGETTLVLMQVGSFFEFYGVNNDIEKIGDVQNICEILNIQSTRKNKKIIENNRKNALLGGFPLNTLQKYVNVLLNNNYTIILIEQTTDPPNPTREITNIFSPATYISDINTPDANFIISCFISEELCYKTGNIIYSIGLNAIDLSTGINIVYEINEDITLNVCRKNNNTTVFEDLFRFIESYNPKEIIINTNKLTKMDYDDIHKLFITHNRYINLKINDYPIEINDINYQNNYLKNIYNNTCLLSTIEYLNMETKIYSLRAFLLLLHYVEEHDKIIIKKINEPILWDKSKHLELYNNCLYQLNVINNPTINNNNKINSLFDVINKTNTSMGKRLLKYRILNPITNINILNKSYNNIEYFRGIDINDIRLHLKNIVDIERLHRKMSLGILSPFYWQSLNDSYYHFQHIIDNNNILNKIDNLDETDIEIFKKFIDEYKNIFIIDEISKWNNNTKNELTFFKEGFNSDLDNLNQKIIDSKNELDKIAISLSDQIDKSKDNVIKIEYTEKDGYYLSTTKKRYEILKKNVSNLIIKKLSNSVKISSDEIDNISNNIISNKTRIQNKTKELYLEVIINFSNNYYNTLKKITNFIAELDVILSHTICSNEYGYCKPEIIEEDCSFINGEDMRHPIIERVYDNTEYITNSVRLDNSSNGILLFGVNGVGKSALSKAIGLNIILAQIGMYVSCKKFQYYPFTKIFTRISTEDNIFKGQSSFIVEMNELRSILKYSDENSLVLGDEVCKGTEEESARAIIASSVRRFSNKNVKFVLATHLHKLVELDCIKELNNIKIKHLSISYDYENELIIYDRKLKDGISQSIYGIEVAQYILNDKEFIKDANSIRDNFKKVKKNKRSNYNKKVFVEKCAICNSKNNLETHHIIFQSQFDNNDLNRHVKKNNKNNLVVLCEKHHNEIHNGKLRINGYKQSVNNVILDYYEVK